MGRESRALMCGVGMFLLAVVPSASAATNPNVWAGAFMPADGHDDDHMYDAQADAACPFGFAGGSQAHAYGSQTSTGEGTLKAWSQLTAHDPVFGNYLSGQANVETFYPFVITSPTLPGGTPVTVDIDVSFAGTLEALEDEAGLSSRALAESGIWLKEQSSGTYLVDEEGEAWVWAYSDRFEPDTIGIWNGALTATPAEGVYDVSYGDTFSVMGMVGQVYELTIELQTVVRTSEGADWDTFDNTFAKADFWDTGTYVLHSPDDVGFVVVPEPAMLVMLWVGGLMALRRRR